MRRFVITVVLAYSFIGIYAQETKPKLDIYGYVRSDIYANTYNGVNAVRDNFYLLPSYSGIDIDGNALNEATSLNFGAMATRFGFKLCGTEFMGAKVSALIETDFIGEPSEKPYLLRLRHANITFEKKNFKLLAGQTWHPYFLQGGMPFVSNLNAGAPFQPFNRSPQLGITLRNSELAFTLSAVTELQYLSVGPQGKSDYYQRNAVLPELIANLEFASDGHKIGISGGLKKIRPLLSASGNLGTKITEETVKGVTGLAYYNFSNGLINVMAKSILAQNSSYILMPGGYAVSSRDTSGFGKEIYTPYTNSTTILSMSYGKSDKIAITGAYMKNLGTADALFSDKNGATTIYGFAPTVQSMYRVSCGYTKVVGNINLMAEFELTSANYGSGIIDVTNGLYSSTVNATNERLIISAVYNF